MEFSVRPLSPPELDSFHGRSSASATNLPIPKAAGQFLNSITAGVLSRLPWPYPFADNSKGAAVGSSSKALPPPHPFHGAGSCSSSTASGAVIFPFHNFSHQAHGQSQSPSALGSLSTGVRIDGLNSSLSGGRGGPAFVGQVFSMCDPSGTGLMAVTTHFNIPFLSKRAPEWMKKALSAVIKSENSGPVFRFFMDLSDAVAYVKRLNIPTGMVGACRLDVAYGHFQEKPNMFQFVPNAKQVKAATKLLKANKRRSAFKKLDGVPVFTAQNLNIAIATNDGIKWYTPYFFDKNMLDNILEASVDQHFHTLIQNRHGQRRRDAIDDNISADEAEEFGDNLFEPPEVQEVLDEMGHPGIPLSVISKVAEIQMLDVVDRVLLGNRWLRKATGIQPKFPYMVDSFEARSAASVLKSKKAKNIFADKDIVQSNHAVHRDDDPEHTSNECSRHSQGAKGQNSFHFPFLDWFSNPWLKPLMKEQETTDPILSTPKSFGDAVDKLPSNPLLPKITMVGISTGEAGKASKGSLKKTMDDLTKELEHTSQRTMQHDGDQDPLFVANVGDYSTITRMNSA